MDTLLCNQDGTILFGDAVSEVLSSQETLAFFYTGSATQATYTWNAEGVTYADILIVGGGGGSQSSADNANARGGGGGGEVVFRQGVAVSPNTTIKVGRGGPIATNGGISEFGAIQANGGGTNATAGGSGGGANRNVTVGGVSSKLSVDGMGNAGGVSIAGTVGAAGGGGAMEPGFTVPAGGQGSNGGQGYTANVFGVWNTVYGSGGGGGARNNTVSLGGTNGGAGGSGDGTPAAQPGVANTGGGAGGAGANGTSRPGAVGGSGIVLVKPNPGILDGLGSSVYSTALGAYAMRRLFGAYTGPQARLRRSTDSTEIDVYFDKYGRPVNFDLDGWLAGATGYVVTWYDQGPAVKHTTGYASGATTLPVLYKREDGIYVVSFTGTSTTVGNYFDAGSITFNVATNGGVSTFSSVNFKGANNYERVYDYGNGTPIDNILLVRNTTTTTVMFQIYYNTTLKSQSVTNGIVNNAWKTYVCQVQGSASTWRQLVRVNGVETTTSITSTPFADRDLMNTYIGRSPWATDSYSDMYLESQLFFNTGAISSSQFKVMENVMSYQFFGGRYVRLQHTVNNAIINLRELQVYDTNNVNIALNQPVTGNTPSHASYAYSMLTDGITNSDENVGHSTGYQIAGDNYDYIQVDLGSMRAITRIVIYNRTATTSVRSRAIGIKVQILADDGITIINEQATITSANNIYTFNY